MVESSGDAGPLSRRRAVPVVPQGQLNAGLMHPEQGSLVDQIPGWDLLDRAHDAGPPKGAG